jgi:hypothetical protein
VWQTKQRRRRLRILPAQVHGLYNRRHFNVDPRFVYGLCVGGQFEAMLKTGRKWSERDARALTDRAYQDGLLDRMMRQGLWRH